MTKKPLTDEEIDAVAVPIIRGMIREEIKRIEKAWQDKIPYGRGRYLVGKDDR